jgi:predicted transcriptional regulator
MKTAISIPDAEFAAAERFARKKGLSRSQLYRQAVAEYVSRRDPDGITEALDRVAAEVKPGLDRFGRANARRSLRRVDW